MTKRRRRRTVHIKLFNRLRVRELSPVWWALILAAFAAVARLYVLLCGVLGYSNLY